MIKCEFFEKTSEGFILCKTYSDANYLLLQNETGNKYSEAIDIAIEENGIYKPKYFTYTETNELFEEIQQDSESAYQLLPHDTKNEYYL